MIPPFTPSGILHSQLPNTAFSIVEEIYSKLPALMNLRDMLYALDKNPDFFTNVFKSSNYYGISFKEDYLETLGYDPKSIKDMQILATHIMGDSSYTRFYFKDMVEVPNQDGTVNYLIYTFLLPKIRDIAKFTVYSKDRSVTREITVGNNNVYVVDADSITSLSVTTQQSFAEVLPAINSTVVTGGGGNGSSSEPVELPDNIVFYDPNSLSDAYPASVPNWNQITSKPYETLHTGASLLIDEEPYHLPKGILYLTTVNSNYNTYHLVSADGDVLFNVDELITTANVDTAISNYLSNSDYVTSSDIPEVPNMSGYVQTSEVANAANKIPRYNSQGHLVLPDGTEIWCEDNA